MIKTLTLNNKSFANLANVQVQPTPVNNDVVQQVKLQSVANVNFSTIGVPPSEAKVSVPLIVHTSDAVTSAVSTSLASIVKTLSDPTVSAIINSPKQVSISGFAAAVNEVEKATIKVSLKSFASVVSSYPITPAMLYDPRSSQDYATTTVKFQPYELLTGISHERPEIIMLTNFQPLFHDDGRVGAEHQTNNVTNFNMTNAGKYVDTQLSLRSVRMTNVQRQLKMLRSNYKNIDEQLSKRKDDFSYALKDLKNDAMFLLNLVRVIEQQKSQLDLRNDIYTVNPVEAATYISNNFTSLSKPIAPASKFTSFVEALRTTHSLTYDFVDCMLQLGYSEENVRSVYASTKIWLQLALELKNILRHHSLSFVDIDAFQQRNDDSPTSILKPNVQYFDVSTNLPTIATVDELINLQGGQSSKSIGDISPVFSSLYQSVFFKNEEARIAALANLLSKEFRYSDALSKEETKRTLSTLYGYAVSDTTSNVSMFDAIVGTFGNNISDFSAVKSRSLASVSQNTAGLTQANSVGILTFETKYVEGDTGTITPGGDFYFDRILHVDGNRFDTTAIDELSTQLNDQVQQLSSVIDTFNLLSIRDNDKSTSSNVDVTLNNPIDIVSSIAKQLFNVGTGEPSPLAQQDKLCAVFSYAKSNNRLKTALFLYTLCRITRAYKSKTILVKSSTSADNTAIVDELVEQIVSTLEKSAFLTKSVIQLVNSGVNTSTISSTSLKNSLKVGSKLTNIIEQFMSEVLTQFRVKTTALNGNYTRHAGYLDTVVMMMAFDLVVSMVSLYGDQVIVGTSQGSTTYTSNQTLFEIAQTNVNHLSSYNELTQRLTSESTLTQQILMTFVDAMRKLSGSLNGISNYLNGADASKKIAEISSVLNNDVDMMRMLFSEQQILMLSSIVENLTNAYDDVTKSGKYTYDNSYKDAVKNADEIALLDESVIDPAAKDALYSYFGSGDNASNYALNKRILTVGIPLGFSQRLKQKITLKNQKRSSFSTKKNDIIKLCIYKVDVQNPDIVYSPQEYMFELSRFPVRYSTKTWSKLPQSPTIDDIISSIPTQCYIRSNDRSSVTINSGIEYYSLAASSNTSLGNAKIAFDDKSYSFLSNTQKREILKNHIESQLIETYIKLTTGINVSEHSYHMVAAPPSLDADFVKTLVEHSVTRATDYVNADSQKLIADANSMMSSTVFRSTISKNLSNAAGVAGAVNKASIKPIMKLNALPLAQQSQSTKNLASALGSLQARSIPTVIEQVRNVSNLVNAFTSISSKDALNHAVLSPKQFDRVFNVLVDPHEFTIDVEKTLSTPFGRRAIELMVQRGEIVPYSSNGYVNGQGAFDAGKAIRDLSSFGTVDANINNYVYRERDKTQGDVIAEKYFVTIETLDEVDEV